MSGVQSIQRAFLVLQRLASQPMGVTQLAESADLPKSTVARLLKTLEMEGAVERVDESGRYRIGPGLATLAGASSTALDLIGQVRPHLVQLADETGEDAGLSVPDGYKMHYIDQADSENAVQVRDWTGELAPMHAVPSGLVVLAHWPEAALERFLRRPLDAYTPSTMTDPEQLRTRLGRIRTDGHAWVFEEFAEGINSVAAPILDRRGRPRGAIHVHGPAYRFPPEGEDDRVAGLVTERAAVIAEQLAALQTR